MPSAVPSELLKCGIANPYDVANVFSPKLISDVTLYAVAARRQYPTAAQVYINQRLADAAEEVEPICRHCGFDNAGHTNAAQEGSCLVVVLV